MNAADDNDGNKFTCYGIAKDANQYWTATLPPSGFPSAISTGAD